MPAVRAKVDILDLRELASLISLGVTLLNTYLLVRVRQGIVLNLTLEPILLRLRKNSEQMNGYLSYYEFQSIRFFEVVGICEADIRATRRRLGPMRGWFLRDLLKSMRKYKKDRTQPNAQEVYVCLLHTSQGLANMLEERRITG
jgi:hypothetical protein